ncbi:MAG: 23S rRNA pseudouridine2457 synthase [Cellvibrionaceae bacterium]
MARLILFNKPYQVLSQFTDEKCAELKIPKSVKMEKRKTLADFIKEKAVYPAGRLDYDSEGLLLLTDNGGLQHQISHPKHKLPKTYWLQVEGAPNKEAINKLKAGVQLKDGITMPAKVGLIEPPQIWERYPPVRFRQKIPTHWIELTITEGRNRQVRRMTASVGLPTLRLMRYSIGSWNIDNLQSGQWIELEVPSADNQTTSQKPFLKRNKK